MGRSTPHIAAFRRAFQELVNDHLWHCIMIERVIVEYVEDDIRVNISGTYQEIDDRDASASQETSEEIRN
jgi:hypothetical protein